MIWNVIDRRTRPYRWANLNVIIEATYYDNALRDADQVGENTPETDVVFDERQGIALHDAINWANTQSCPVTLYLYDGWNTPRPGQP